MAEEFEQTRYGKILLLRSSTCRRFFCECGSPTLNRLLLLICLSDPLQPVLTGRKPFVGSACWKAHVAGCGNAETSQYFMVQIGLVILRYFAIFCLGAQNQTVLFPVLKKHACCILAHFRRCASPELRALQAASTGSDHYQLPQVHQLEIPTSKMHNFSKICLFGLAPMNLPADAGSRLMVA